MGKKKVLVLPEATKEPKTKNVPTSNVLKTEENAVSKPQQEKSVVVEKKPPGDSPDPAALVVLDNLPMLFSDATLKTIIAHVPCVGKVLSHRIEQGATIFAKVQFELKDDADAAIKLWDQLTVDKLVISAWCPHENPKRPLPVAGGSPTGSVGFGVPQPAPSSSAHHRYPFAPMSIGWLVEHVNGLKGSDKSFTMCRILECLMNNAIATNEPFMECAVVSFYSKFPASAWTKAQHLMSDGIAFELCRQVFEVLGLVRKYPTANAKSRKMLLMLVERLVEDIGAVTVATKVLVANKAIPEIVSSIRTQLGKLRQGQTDTTKDFKDSKESFESLVQWLKFLFSCLSTHQGQVPSFPEAATTVHCSEQCPCYQALQQKFPVFLNDVEKAKVIDSLIVNAVRDGDDYVGNIAEALMERYPNNFIKRAVTHVQNGEFLILRIRVFVALRTAKRIHSYHKNVLKKFYDDIGSVLHMVRDQVGDVEGLRSIGPFVEGALVCVNDLRDVKDIHASALQQLYTLQFDLSQIFNALCAQHFLLCIHPVEGTNFVKKTQAKCGNASCPGTSTELLKCSGCRSTYYCSVDCQRADWKTHKVLCKEMTARMSPNSNISPGTPPGFSAIKSPILQGEF